MDIVNASALELIQALLTKDSIANYLIYREHEITSTDIRLITCSIPGDEAYDNPSTLNHENRTHQMAMP